MESYLKRIDDTIAQVQLRLLREVSFLSTNAKRQQFALCAIYEAIFAEPELLETRTSMDQWTTMQVAHVEKLRISFSEQK